MIPFYVGKFMAIGKTSKGDFGPGEPTASGSGAPRQPVCQTAPAPWRFKRTFSYEGSLALERRRSLAEHSCEFLAYDRETSPYALQPAFAKNSRTAPLRVQVRAYWPANEEKPMKPTSQPTYKNCVLALLPAHELKRLAPHLSPASFKRNRSLHEPGEQIETVYFLEEGIASVMVAMEDGTTIEVGLIGRDGLVGLPAVMGNGRSANRTFIQIPGHGYTIKAKILREQCETSSELRACLQRAIQGFFVQTAQTAACNRVHELEERLARWLLMCHDRVQSDHMPITHEFLAMMLGTRRSSVSVAAGILHKAGLIVYSRGHMKIQDRERLQHAACECYQAVREEYLHLGLL